MFISNYACQQATPTNMDQPPSGGCHGHGGVILNSQKRIQHKQKFFDIIYSDYGNRILVMLFDAKFQKMGTLVK
jgi:hypothetical protein